jgi:hypothetical protein
VREGIIMKAEKMWAQIQEESFGREELRLLLRCPL